MQNVRKIVTAMRSDKNARCELALFNSCRSAVKVPFAMNNSYEFRLEALLPCGRLLTAEC